MITLYTAVSCGCGHSQLYIFSCMVDPEEKFGLPCIVRKQSEPLTHSLAHSLTHSPSLVGVWEILMVLEQEAVTKSKHCAHQNCPQNPSTSMFGKRESSLEKAERISWAGVVVGDRCWSGRKMGNLIRSKYVNGVISINCIKTICFSLSFLSLLSIKPLATKLLHSKEPLLLFLQLLSYLSPPLLNNFQTRVLSL